MALSEDDWTLLQLLVQRGIVNAEQGRWLLAALQNDSRPLTSWLSQLKIAVPSELVQARLVSPANQDLTPTIDLREMPRGAAVPEATRSAEEHWDSTSRMPERVGPYQIDRLLGRGGAGAVYAATHVDQGHVVAIKFLHSEQGSEEGQRARFLAEARLAASLPIHPHIVRVIDAGVQDDWCYIVLEYIRGFTLRNLMEAGKVSPKAGLRVLSKIADALAHIHDHGIVHRDIKPENILIDANSEPRLTDFGIARKDDASSMTATSAILVGTALYMAPEQAEDARSVDGRADIYAMGAVLYEILSGQPVFPAESLVEVLAKKLDGRIKPLREWNSELSESYEAICLKALARAPEDRYQSAAELRDAMNQARSGDSDRLQSLTLDSSSASRIRRSSAARPQLKSPAAVPVSLALVGGLALLLGFMLLVHSQRAPELSPTLVEAKWWSEGQHYRDPLRRCEFRLDRPASALLLRLVNERGEVLDVIAQELGNEIYRVDSSLNEGSWHAELFLQEGGARALSSLKSVRFVIDQREPEIRLRDPSVGKSVGKLVEGQVIEKNPSRFLVNEKEWRLDASGQFSIPWPESSGGLKLYVIDKAGNESRLELSPPRPQAVPSGPVEDAEIQNARLTYFNLPGATIPENSWPLRGRANPPRGRLKIGDHEIEIQSDGTFQVQLKLAQGRNVFPVLWDPGVIIPSRVVIDADLEAPELELAAELEFPVEGTLRIRLRASEALSRLSLVAGPRRVDYDRPQFKQSGHLFMVDFKFGAAESLEIIARDLLGNESRKEIGLKSLLGGKVEAEGDSAGEPKAAARHPDSPLRSAQAATSLLVEYGVAKPGQKDLPVTFRSLREGRTCLRSESRVLAELDGGRPVTVAMDRRALRSGVILKVEGAGFEESLYLGPGLSLILSYEAWRDAARSREGREKQEQELRLIAWVLGADFRRLETLSIKLEEGRVLKSPVLRIGVFEHGASGLTFHLIPGGEVLIGLSPTQEAAVVKEFGTEARQQIHPGDRRAKGARAVRVGPFLIASTEVSVAQWTLLGGERSQPSLSGEEPVTGIRLDQAEAWLATIPGTLRLPFSSEWEYACRGGLDTIWDSRDRFVADQVWGRHNTTRPRSVREHQGMSNNFGLSDMLGNASEWARPDPGSSAALRLKASLHGGSFASGLFYAAMQSPRVKGEAEVHSGFRPARGLEPMRINRGLWAGDAR